MADYTTNKGILRFPMTTRMGRRICIHEGVTFAEIMEQQMKRLDYDTDTLAQKTGLKPALITGLLDGTGNPDIVRDEVQKICDILFDDTCTNHSIWDNTRTVCPGSNPEPTAH